jgi:subtilisin family serine protease
LINKVQDNNSKQTSSAKNRQVEQRASEGDNTPKKSDDTFSPMSMFMTEVHSRDPHKKSDFIVIPPKDCPEKTRSNSILKTVSSKDSDKKDFQIKEPLPILNGYIASLNTETVDNLRDQGFLVASDKRRLVLHDPDDGFITDGKVNADIFYPAENDLKAEEEISLDIRPAYETPRFDTPLTRKYNGKDVGIAIIDSGIHPHSDFLNPESRIVEFIDFVQGKTEPYDDRGHGTHVAGCAAGNGIESEGLYKGMASEANLIGLKALSGEGKAKSSDIIKSIQWCIENKEKHNIRVINLSLGFKARKDYDNEPINIAIRKAREAGIVVVASAGNKGPQQGTITSPGDCWSTISVGAADDRNTPDPSDDIMTKFSSRGPAAGGVMKPDLVAPGEGVISTLAPGTYIEKRAQQYSKLTTAMQEYFEMSDEDIMNIPREELASLGIAKVAIDRWYESPASARQEAKKIFEISQRRQVFDDIYTSLPGTSMASPIVAGTAAAMLEANPDLTPGQVMTVLTKTADKLPVDEPVHVQGSGMVNPHNAIQMALDAKEGKVVIEEPEINRDYFLVED